MTSDLLVFGGILLGIWATVRYFLFYVLFSTVRIDNGLFQVLYDEWRDEKWKFIMEEQIVPACRYPDAFTCFGWFKSFPMLHVSHTERILQAGYSAKDSVTHLHCLRWSMSKLKKSINHLLSDFNNRDKAVPVEIVTPYFFDKIGTIKSIAPAPLANKSSWGDFYEKAEEVLLTGKGKTGAIFYGPPGNGKTHFVKFLATKFRVPIRIMTFDSELKNVGIMHMFGVLQDKCIVVFEDFDSYFDKKKCLLGGEKGANFTFDAILNGLDGVYNSYEGIVFIMTVNDIEKVDTSLTERPSRFQFVKEFPNPDIHARMQLLPEGVAMATEGMNLDQILRVKEYLANGNEVDEAISKVGVKERAFCPFISPYVESPKSQ